LPVRHQMKVNQMSFEDIFHVLKNEMGLSPETVGLETVERIVERRMKAVGEKTVASYCRLVKSSADEKQALFNEISVPETWFFRDHEPFRALSGFVKELGLGEGVLNILSIPCSTGEEPYSIAMVLNDVGLSKDRFRIDAADISTEVLKKARKGIYSDHSFRGKDIAYRDKYFKHKDGEYFISDDIKSTVNFVNRNVLEQGFMSGKGPYDVVFCRNLLIYFDYETKCKVLNTLSGLMSQKAMLVLGHAETGRMPEGVFESLHLPGSFAYQKAGACVPKSKKTASVFASTASFVSSEIKPSKSAAHASAKKTRVVETVVPTAENVDEWVASIQALADAGQLKEAITECDCLIEAVPDSAQGYYLKGVVLLAFDADVDATAAFKKAVYLDPKNYQSLIHLAVLSEELGELRASENYRARAERLRKSAQVSIG